jgi:hypothetical protein
MTPSEVLTLCRKAGLRVSLKGDNFWVTPQTKLTNELRALLIKHKPAIRALLQRADRVDDAQDICPECGALFVDICGRGKCLTCVEPANRVVA